MTMLQEHVRRVTSKGQVTIPVDVRKLLGIRPGDKVSFHLKKNEVRLTRTPFSLAEAYGSVMPLQQPEDFSLLRETALAEHAEKVLKEMEEG